MTHIIYFDAVAAARHWDGYGWQVSDGTRIVSRHSGWQRAVTECRENEWPFILLTEGITPHEAVGAIEYAFDMRGVG